MIGPPPLNVYFDIGMLTPHLKVLEFYSGIGGMHYASRAAGWDCEILKAFDINDIANNIYKHNFGAKTVGQKLIEGLDVAYFEKWGADVWTMSPPCQPYTRIGLQHGSQDPRSKSFLHLLKVLDTIKCPPSYILVENVKGFETSDSRDMLVHQLEKSNYTFQEFLLTPNKAIGMPNSRLRYYLLAKLKPLSFAYNTADSTTILDFIPYLSKHTHYCDKQVDALSNYLEPNVKQEEYAVPDKVLLKNGYVFDIVTPSSLHSCCFTKGYYHYAQGTGSILQMNEALNAQDIFNQVQAIQDVPSQLKLLHSLKLRYFTPREVANLMGFPADFQFPPTATKKQQYRTLGNSINVTLVSHLMHYLLMP